MMVVMVNGDGGVVGGDDDGPCGGRCGEMSVKVVSCDGNKVMQ